MQRRKRWCKRHRHGKIGRQPKPVAITEYLPVKKLLPIPQKSSEIVYLDSAELEALRLIDLQKLSLEEAGREMNVSRNTVWRLARNAREKIIHAIIEGKQIFIEKG
jgi:predicted DNA-binding protein (UPF0251 family)